MSLNRCTIMGRLGRNPEIRTTQSGVKVASFSLAVDRDFKDKTTGERETDWINVTAWRGAAELAEKYLAKGRMCVVDGRLQMRKWTDKDGNDRISAEVVAGSIYFADSKQDPGGAAGYSAAPKSAGTPVNIPYDVTDEIDDGDLPF